MNISSIVHHTNDTIGVLLGLRPTSHESERVREVLSLARGAGRDIARRSSLLGPSASHRPAAARRARTRLYRCEIAGIAPATARRASQNVTNNRPASSSSL